MKNNSTSNFKKAFQRYHSFKADVSAESRRNMQSFLGELVSNKTDVSYNIFQHDDIPYMWTAPIKYTPSSRKILYCHGGGYVIGDISYCKILSSKLSSQTGLEVLSFEYPLAPEHPYPAQLDSAFSAIEYLSKYADEISIVGESAGGHLVLSLVNKLKESGRKDIYDKIRSIVVMSPWTDLTLSGESYDNKADTDPILSYDAVKNFMDNFLSETYDLYNPYISPINTNFTSFPDALIQVGSNEILLDDSINLHEKMKSYGVKSYFSVWKDMWHIFQTFPEAVLPNAKEAIIQSGKFILDRFS